MMKADGSSATNFLVFFSFGPPVQTLALLYVPFFLGFPLLALVSVFRLRVRPCIRVRVIKCI
jgi:hypothetical protein